MKTLRDHSQSGSSLISVMIGIGIMCIMTSMAGTVIQRTRAGSQRAELKGEIEDVRADLRQSIGCQETFTNAVKSACKAGRYVSVMARTNSKGSSKVLITPPKGTTFQRWQSSSFYLRAWCGPERTVVPSSTSSKVRLIIQLNRMSPSGTVKKDPLTGKMLDGSPWDGGDDPNRGWDPDLFDGVDLCVL